jgi:hypothetical protein
VHVGGHQCHNDLSLKRCELATHELSQLSELGLVQVIPFLEGEGIVAHLIDVEFGGVAPRDLSDGGDDLTEVGQHPLLSLGGCIVVETHLQKSLESVTHLALD